MFVVVDRYKNISCVLDFLQALFNNTVYQLYIHMDIIFFQGVRSTAHVLGNIRNLVL